MSILLGKMVIYQENLQLWQLRDKFQFVKQNWGTLHQEEVPQCRFYYRYSFSCTLRNQQ